MHDCSSAFQKAQHIVHIEYQWPTISVLYKCEFLVDLTFDQYQLLVDKVTTEVEGACTHEAGYVYNVIFMQSTFAESAEGS